MAKSLTLFLLLIVLGATLAAIAGKDMSNLERSQKILELDAEAQEDMASGSYKSAAKTYHAMYDLAPTRREKAIQLLKAADAYFKAEKGHKALEDYTILLEDYPLYIPYGYVIGQMRQLAEDFVVGEKTTLWFTDVPKAIKIYESIIREAPAEHISRQDRFRLAELLCQEDREEEAVAIYQSVIKQNTRDWEARAKLGLLLGKLAKVSDGDGAKTRAAVREIKLVLAYQPDHPQAEELKALLADADELSARRLFESAQFYLNPAHKRLHAARRYLHDVISKYPDSHYAMLSRDLLRLNPQLAQLELEITNPELAKKLAEEAKGPKPVFEPKPQAVKDNSLAFEPVPAAPEDKPAFQPVEPKKDGDPALKPRVVASSASPALPRRAIDPEPAPIPAPEPETTAATENTAATEKTSETEDTPEAASTPVNENTAAAEKTSETEDTPEAETPPSPEDEPAVKPLFAALAPLPGNTPAFQPLPQSLSSWPVFNAVPSADGTVPAFAPIPVMQNGTPAFQARIAPVQEGPALERRPEDTLPYVKTEPKSDPVEPVPPTPDTVDLAAPAPEPEQNPVALKQTTTEDATAPQAPPAPRQAAQPESETASSAVAETKAEPAPVVQDTASDTPEPAEETAKPLFETRQGSNAPSPAFAPLQPACPDTPVFPFRQPSQSDAPAFARMLPKEGDAPAFPAHTVAVAPSPALPRRREDTLPPMKVDTKTNAAPLEKELSETEPSKETEAEAEPIKKTKDEPVTDETPMICVQFTNKTVEPMPTPVAPPCKPALEPKVAPTADAPAFQLLAVFPQEDCPIFPPIPGYGEAEAIFPPGVLRCPRRTLRFPQSALECATDNASPAFQAGIMLAPADTPQYK